MKHCDFQTLEGAIRAGAEDCANAPAVYFLYKDGALVYIGRSVDALNRTRRHNICGWDKAVALPTAEDKLEEVEGLMIDALQPPWNRAGVHPDKWQAREVTQANQTSSKEIRLKCTDEVLAAADLAATRVGLTTSAYARMALIERMARDGIHPEQPRAD